jgi:hypothetical protein
VNGRKLMQLPRVTVMDLNDPLPQFRGELDAVLFHGVVGGRDHKTPHEGGSHSFFGFIRGMMKVMKAVDPSDELWLFHRATGTVWRARTWPGCTPRPTWPGRPSWPARC